MILVISQKMVYATQRLIQEAKKQEVGLEVLSAGQLAEKNFKISVKKYQVLYIRNPYVKSSPEFLPLIVNLAKKFQAAGRKVVDCAIADGHLGEGKWEDYQQLKKAGLPIPATWQFLEIARSASDEAIPFRDRLLRPSAALGARNFQKTYPLILKWTYGFKGKNVFLVRNETELRQVAKKYPKDELLIQEFIDAEYEYKVITVGYKTLPVVLRFSVNPKNHRPDFKQTKIIPVGNGRDRSLRKIIDISERASRLLGRELSKVDILQAKDKFYILEVNRFPGLESFEKLTKYNVTGEFLHYLMNPS